MAKPIAGYAAKDRRRVEGAERNEAWRKMTPLQQLADLDRRLGKGVGARRQRIKLATRMAI